MKTVHTSDMVAHLWANQSQSEARNSSRSYSFRGAVLYSYDTPVAMLHDTKRAGRVALVTSDGYSMTTKSKHLPCAHRALRDVARSFFVPYVGAYGGYASRDPFTRHAQDPQGSNDSVNGWHTANVKYLAGEYYKLGGQLRRARWLHHTSAEDVRITLEGAAFIVREYCEAFGLVVPALDPADDARVIWRAREIRDEKARSPAEIFKREKARAAAERRKAESERVAQIERFAREAEMRERFRNRQQYGNGYARCSDERGGALLRVDADAIRTSWGAECPLEDARRAFPLIAKWRERGEQVNMANNQPNGLARLGSFTLNEIRADGSIRAGCHVIHWPEIESAARALGVLS